MILQTPSRQLLKQLLWTYAQKRVIPRVPAIASGLIAAFEAVLAIDFSACDARQLRRLGVKSY